MRGSIICEANKRRISLRLRQGLPCPIARARISIGAARLIILMDLLLPVVGASPGFIAAAFGRTARHPGQGAHEQNAKRRCAYGPRVRTTCALLMVRLLGRRQALLMPYPVYLHIGLVYHAPAHNRALEVHLIGFLHS